MSVVKSLENESQLRELAKVNTDSLPEVVEKLQEKADAGEKITAKAIKQVVAEFITHEPEEAEPAPEPVDWQKVRLAAVKQGEAMVRTMDDLHSARRYTNHSTAVKAVQNAIGILREID